MKVRAVILVHGVGEQPKGEVLEAVLEPLLRFLRGNFPDVQARVVQRPEAGPASATVRFLDERWEVMEAWWAQAFYPQKRFRVLRWFYRALILNVASYLVGTLPLLRGRLWLRLARAFYPKMRRGMAATVLYGLMWLPKALVLLLWAALLAAVYVALLLAGAVMEIALGLLGRQRGVAARQTVNPLWRLAERLSEPPSDAPGPRRLPGATASVWSRLYDLIVGLFFTVVFALTYVPLLVVATLLYLLALLPPWLLFPRWLGTAVSRITASLVEGFGDQYALMYTETAASAARQRLRDLLALYLDPRSPGHRPCDSVTVIAHSAGATVALGVLSDPRTWEEWTGGQAPAVPVSFFTVGSSLTVSHENVPGHPMFRHPLPPWVAWLDLWARYDPVPHGPPNAELRRKVRGPQGRFDTTRVVNRDTPFADHTTYWTNHEEVLSLFLHEVTGQPDLASADQDEVSKAVAVLQALDQIDARRRRVAFTNLAAVLALGGFAVVAGIGAGLFAKLGAWILNTAPGVIQLPAWLTPLPPGAVHFALGLGAFGIGAYALVQLAVLWLGAYLYRDPWGGAGSP